MRALVELRKLCRLRSVGSPRYPGVLLIGVFTVAQQDRCAVDATRPRSLPPRKIPCEPAPSFSAMLEANLRRLLIVSRGTWSGSLQPPV